jgi:hypothetical protein
VLTWFFVKNDSWRCLTGPAAGAAAALSTRMCSFPDHDVANLPPFQVASTSGSVWPSTAAPTLRYGVDLPQPSRVGWIVL